MDFTLIKKPFLWAAAAAVLLPAQLAAQVKVGVVNFQQALLATAEMQKEQDKLQAKFAPRQDQLEKLSADLEDIQKKMQAAPEAEAQRLQLEGQRKQRDAQRLSEDLQSDVEFERNTVLQGGSRKMREVIQQLAVEKGLDMVVDVNSTIYFKDALDISKEATAKYDATYQPQ
jgi:outer membrane protein